MINPRFQRHLHSSLLSPVALVALAAVVGCAHEHHYHEREAIYYEPGPAAVVAAGPIDVIADPDPVIVERERYYLNEPDAIVVRGNDYYFHDRRITDERELRAVRLAYQARESHYARHPEFVRDAREAKAAKPGRIDAEHREERGDIEHRDERPEPQR